MSVIAIHAFASCVRSWLAVMAFSELETVKGEKMKIVVVRGWLPLIGVQDLNNAWLAYDEILGSA